MLGDFAKLDRDWLEPLLDTVADNADLLVQGNDGEFMNRIHKAVTGKGGDADETSAPARKAEAGGKPAAKGQSHIRQARAKTKPELPKEGPLAAMLKGLLGSKDTN